MSQNELKAAFALLHKVLETQPNVIYKESGLLTPGQNAAKFCTDFMDSYEEWAKQKNQ